MFMIVRKSDGLRLPPAMDDDGTSVFLAWETKKDAKNGLKFQVAMGYLDKDDIDDWEIVEIVSEA